MKYSHRMKTLISCLAFLCACGSTSASVTSVELARTDRAQGQPIFTAQVNGTAKADVEKLALEKAKGGCPKGMQSLPIQQRSSETVADGKSTFDVMVAFVCYDPNEE